MLSSVACPALRYFSRYLINNMIFEKEKFIENKMHVLNFCANLSEKFLIVGIAE